MLTDKLRSVLTGRASYERDALRACMDELRLTVADVEPFLVAPGERPYGRKLLFANDDVEVIVMNWSPQRSCLPHDHGRSEGWVQVMAGAVVHTVFSRRPASWPEVASVTIESAGARIYAPPAMVHAMAAADRVERVVTLHFYHPPIHGMQVFDLEAGAACIVADDCGAWWPPAEQLVRVIPGPAAREGTVGARDRVNAMLPQVAPGRIQDTAQMYNIYLNEWFIQVGDRDDAPSIVEFSRWVWGRDTHNVFVARSTEDGRIVGWALLRRFHERPAYAPTGEIVVAVEARSRCRGYGSALVTAARNAARWRDLKSVVCLAPAPAEDAGAGWASSGDWIRVGTVARGPGPRRAADIAVWQGAVQDMPKAAGAGCP